MTATESRPRTDDPPEIDFEDVPGTVPDGSTLLVAKPAPLEEYALTPRLVDRYANPDEGRLVVTTTVDADRTIRNHRAISAEASDRLGIVDASDRRQPSSPFQQYPTVSLPHPGELTRIVLALWELNATMSSTCNRTHVVVRSLTPILEEEPIERVARVIDQLADRKREDDGLLVVSVEYTAHDEATMSYLRELVDAVVWAEVAADGPLELEYRRART